VDPTLSPAELRAIIRACSFRTPAWPVRNQAHGPLEADDIGVSLRNASVKVAKAARAGNGKASSCQRGATGGYGGGEADPWAAGDLGGGGRAPWPAGHRLRRPRQDGAP
jgi:hypothetical protein